MAGLALTNCTCKLYSHVISYKGEDVATLEDTVDGWLDEGSVLSYRKELPGLVLIGEATLFLWDDVTTEGRTITIGSENYEIISWRKYTEPDDNAFHHLELVLK